MTTPGSNPNDPSWSEPQPEQLPQPEASQAGQPEYLQPSTGFQQPAADYGQIGSSFEQTAAPFATTDTYGLVNPQTAPKNYIVALLLAWFLGSLGVHNFYLGYTQRGIIQLSLTAVGWLTVWLLVGFLFIIGVAIWAFVEFIMIAIRHGQYAHDSNGVPLVS